MPLPFIRERRLWGESGNQDFEGQLQAPSDVLPTEQLGTGAPA